MSKYGKQLMARGLLSYTIYKLLAHFPETKITTYYKLKMLRHLAYPFQNERYTLQNL